MIQKALEIFLFRMTHSLLLLVVSISLFIFSSIQFCACEIKDINIVDDSRPIILFERFGFASGGHVDLSIKNVSWTTKFPSAKLNPASMGFFLVMDRAYPRIFNESSYSDDFCVLYSNFVQILFRFNEISLDYSTFNTSLKIDVPEEYNLLFGNCQSEFFVSMKIHTEMYNILNGEKDFLPAGQTILPIMYFIFFIVYVVFFATWTFICIRQRITVYKIHLIMAALLLFMSLKMICASEDKMYIRNTGTPHGWDIAFYIFGFLKGVTLFTVIILIGTGWSFLKPYLQEREKNILAFIIPLQVIENLAAVLISETGPVEKDWFTWNEMFLVIDVVCCITIFIPIFWSIRSLREASKNDGKAARNLDKLTLFRQFYIVVIAYLYFTRFGVPGIGVIVNYRDEWIPIVSAEGASMLFYLFIFYNFQPVVENNPYLVIDDEEVPTSEQPLKEIRLINDPQN
ncbi:hypothetical protein M9H77_34845 [Catharanthus roseus]|uniref:Uncharacterized protein n=1 Tax=Catharanthus roseus TaxID=4058 RepID=A0ACB9ZN31_CATRO|nr:hypothetical protein M9H77_34845 [Catharanthus roseus]